jgi:predicted dehydrogenase
VSAKLGVVVGAGGVARLAHLPGYTRDPALVDRLRIVGAIDPVVTTADLQGLPVFPSLDAAQSILSLDFVDICTPTSTHEPLILDALGRGLHVLCEKPVAITPASAQRLTAAARAADRVLFPCHQYRQNPAWLALRRWIDSGAIGRWHLAEFHVYRGEADRGTASAGVPWRARSSVSLGGVLLDHGTHLLYLLRDVAGMPHAVQAHLSRLAHPEYEVEDTAHLLLDYGDRAATLTLTWAGHGRENRIRFIGETGMVEWVGGMLRLVRSDGSVETADFAAQLDKREYAVWMSRLLQQFADALDYECTDHPLTEIEEVAILLDAAYRSSAEGCRITTG